MRKRKFDFIVDENGCFICTSHKVKKDNAHPMACHGGKSQTVARHIYESCFGVLSEGEVLRHKCDNYKCVNPEHLEVGTQKDNLTDMAMRGRSFSPAGEINGSSKLTKENVIKLREIKGTIPSHKAGEMFGVAGRTVRDIWNGNLWKGAIA